LPVEGVELCDVGQARRGVRCRLGILVGGDAKHVRIQQRLVQDVLVLQKHGSFVTICAVCHVGPDVLPSGRLLSRLYIVSIYAYSGVVRFITDYLIGGYIFTLFDRFYQSTNFFLNLLLYMLTKSHDPSFQGAQLAQ
jgi:hypothetical protein